VTSASLDAPLGYVTPEPPAPVCTGTGEVVSFDTVYEQHFDFVWCNLRRLRVPDALLDDAAQEVFLVVHRRLPELSQHSSLKSWLFGIVLRVARDQRRLLRRKSPHTRSADAAVDADCIADERGESPDASAARSEGAALLHRLLDELDEDKRAVFVMVEIEQMTIPEITDALGVNLNTLYARLRAARRDFEKAVARERAREARRVR
jgi:RNA polymerase sigma-70 factor (ECF subfamily)